jgi:hypothetical protein
MPNEIESIQKLCAFLPVNFQASKILNGYSYTPVKQRNLKACFYYILDTLYHMSQNRKWREEYEKNGGYPLNATIMNKIMGKSYLEALNILEAQQVIVRSDSYQTGKLSKCVALLKPYNSSDIKILEVDHATTVGKKWIVEQKQTNKKNIKALQSIPFVTKWFDPTRIEVDCEELHVFIEFYRSILVKQFSLNPKIKNKQIIENAINYRYNSMLSSIQSLLNGNMNLSKTGKDHRLHSFLSNIKKELRLLITYDGQPLVSIDVKSCQPYLLSYLLQPKNWEKIKSILSSSSIPIYQINKLQSSILMFGLFPESGCSDGLQRKVFDEIVWKDDFYLQIMNKASEMDHQDLFPDKKKTKKKIINIFFDSGWYMNDNEERKLFAKWFPKEEAFIEEVHKISRMLDKKKSKDKNAVINLLPILLQRVESMIMLEYVCDVISKELPDAPLLPVHDCIHTTPPYAEEVRAIMERVLTAEVGVKPGIKVEYYNKQDIMDGLELLAQEDWKEVIAMKHKKKLVIGKQTQIEVKVGMKAPLLMKIPKKGDKQILSTRYVDLSDFDN